jgi:hypothetical protein
MSTLVQYGDAIGVCREIFLRKTADYGTSWRVLRTVSVADQIFIKAQRIRTIQERGERRVADPISAEFIGIANYSIIGLMQLELGSPRVEELGLDTVQVLWDKQVDAALSLMRDKNHDYGEAWRDMSQESLADLILVKVLRIRQILANDGRTIASEGVDANFTDILNYSVFALILIGEGRHRS